MGFSLTAKAHLIFDHSCADQRRFGGLGDKIEDFIEKKHQSQKNLDYVTMRQSSKIAQAQTQSKYEWMMNNPFLETCKQEVFHKTTNLSMSERAERLKRSRKNESHRRRVREAKVRKLDAEFDVE